MKFRNSIEAFFRYFVLIVLGLFNLKIFYLVFTPITINTVYFILGLFDGSTKFIANNIILFSGSYAQIIDACVAGAAYYLLTILNLTTPMHWKKRVKSLSSIIVSFFIINVIRIVVFAILLSQGYQYFDFAHRFFWYFGSTVLVVLIWFANVFLLEIKAIPIYTDMQNIFADILRKK